MALSYTLATAASVSRLVRLGIDSDSDGLRTRIIDLIKTNAPSGGGIASLPSGTTITVYPTGGKWVLPTRPAGAVFLLIPTGGAPLPTAADGVTDQDLIVVGGSTTSSGGGTTSPLGTVLLSDDFTGSASTTVELLGTSADRYAGGDAATWQTYIDASGAGDKHTHRQQGASAVDVYGTASAWLPQTVANSTVTVVVGAPTNGGHVVMRCSQTPPQSPGAAWIGFGFYQVSGALSVAATQRDGTNVTPITSKIAVSAGATVSATLIGQQITLKINGTQVATGTATVTAQPGVCGFQSATYNTINVGSFLVEAA